MASLPNTEMNYSENYLKQLRLISKVKKPLFQRSFPQAGRVAVKKYLPVTGRDCPVFAREFALQLIWPPTGIAEK
jgi:hypothetical protein